ncbi:MAG: AMP-binding protein [Evtepia gabavorous]
MEAFYTQFIQETFDETGQITHWAYTYADNYNYSYDVIDPLGERCSNRLAMLWRNDRGEEKRLTFGALKTLSIQAANLFQSRGLKKGDVIMTALRTHWSYWVVALAAHRLGLVLSPSYYLLTQKDFAFRMQRQTSAVSSPAGRARRRPESWPLRRKPASPALCLGRRRWL